MNFYNSYFFLNNVKIFFDAKSYSLIQYCEFNGVSIPRFCFHVNLSIAGNCRICLVEVFETSKPIVACATEVSVNLKILTNTTLVRVARESILEFLLINHPLDCPICDQGGECDLQDQTLIYGSDRGRFREMKRVVVEKYFGPFIKTVMTRCIHCTRCIRYLTEVGGVKTLGTIGRGSSTEIDTYVNTYINSPVSGNLIDLCPVGALTTKPSAYRARSWEFYSIETIDILDSVCSSIRIDLRGNEIYRILPCHNSILNNDWITDKVRFSYDAYKQQRFLVPLFRTHTLLLSRCSWESIYRYIKIIILPTCTTVSSISTFFFFSGIFIDTYSQLLFKYIASYLGISTINSKYNSNLDFRNSYLLNKPIIEIEHSTFFFFWGLDITIESPILNIRIQKSIYTNPAARTFFIGTPINFNYLVFHIGLSSSRYFDFFYGKLYLCFIYLTSLSPTFFFSSESTIPYFSINLYTISILNTQLSITASYNYVNLFASDVSINELSLVSSMNTFIFDTLEFLPTFIYLLGTVKKSTISHSFITYESINKPFIIYQGSHLDEDIELYNILLPNCTYLETKNKRYFLNCEGTAQLSNQVQTVNSSYLSSDLVLYTLFKYLFNKVVTTWLDIEYFKQMYNLYIPITRFTNTVLSYTLFIFFFTLRPKLPIYILHTLYIVQIRSYYSIDLISRISSTISKYTNLKHRSINFF